MENSVDVLFYLYGKGFLNEGGIDHLIRCQNDALTNKTPYIKETENPIEELGPPPQPPPELLATTTKAKARGRPKKEPPKECAYKFPESSATCANLAVKEGEFCKEHTA